MSSEIMQTLQSHGKQLESIITTLESHGTRLESLDTQMATVIRTLESHSKMLESHGKTLESHSKMLESHGKTLESHSKMLESNSKMLQSHEILLKSHSQKLDSMNEQIGCLALKAVDHDDKLQWLMENTVTRAEWRELASTLDELVGLAKKKDQEMTFMGERLKRIEEHIIQTVEATIKNTRDIQKINRVVF